MDEKKISMALDLLSGDLKKIEDLFSGRLTGGGIKQTKEGIFLSVFFKEEEKEGESRQEKEDKK